MSKRPTGRPKTRWEDDVLEGIKNMNVHNWKKVAQNRDSWKKAVEQATTLYRFGEGVGRWRGEERGGREGWRGGGGEGKMGRREEERERERLKF
jgi:hypothetical protein